MYVYICICIYIYICIYVYTLLARLAVVLAGPALWPLGHVLTRAVRHCQELQSVMFFNPQGISGRFAN